MPIRVSHRSRFTFFIENMNSSLSELMKLNTQASTQKKINKPSDNSSGMVRVMDLRNTLNSLSQYEDNVTEAKGWLAVADDKLTKVNEVLIQLRGLAEQAATGTMSNDNREQASYQARQLMSELVALSNTEYEGNYIFSGHKTGTQAYEHGLWVTDNDGSMTQADGTPNFAVTGALERTALVQFTSGGNLGEVDVDYRFSADGGKSWSTGTIAATAAGVDPTANIGGSQVTFTRGTTVQAGDPTSNSTKADNGTWMWIRPTARYKGDDVDIVDVNSYGGSLSPTASGVFGGNVAVRIDSGDTLTAGNEIGYSYSTDGGVSWTTGQTSTVNTDGQLSLVVPGGHLDFSGAAGDTVLTDSQHIIHPHTGRIELAIGANESIQINNIGKDVFGGVYVTTGNDSPTLASNMSQDRNMFDVVGDLVGYLETNDQQGCQESLAKIDEVSKHIMSNAARVGASENRLNVTENTLGALKLNEKKRLSEVEDADVSELMTQLANQQIIYETVLRSSSMIMRMNLANLL